jgi:hypothetical protein
MPCAVRTFVFSLTHRDWFSRPRVGKPYTITDYPKSQRFNVFQAQISSTRSAAMRLSVRFTARNIVIGSATPSENFT